MFCSILSLIYTWMPQVLVYHTLLLCVLALGNLGIICNGHSLTSLLFFLLPLASLQPQCT